MQRRFYALDGLRLIAALAVLSFHYTGIRLPFWGQPALAEFPTLNECTRYGYLASVRQLGWGKRAISLAPTLLATRAVAGRLRGFYARLDVDSKQTGLGMPKNYVQVAVKPTDPS